MAASGPGERVAGAAGRREERGRCSCADDREDGCIPLRVLLVGALLGACLGVAMLLVFLPLGNWFGVVLVLCLLR